MSTKKQKDIFRNLKSVKIDGMKIKVSFIDSTERLNGYDAWGTCSYRNNELEIANYVSNARKLQIFWHEVLHEIDYNRWHNKLTESDIQILSSAINQVLLDSPELSKIYTELSKQMEK